MEAQLLPFQISVCVCVCVCVMPQVEETQVVTSVTLLADLEDLSVLWWVAICTGSEQGRQPFSCRAGLPSKMIFLCTQPKGASLVFNLRFWLTASYNTSTASSSVRVSMIIAVFFSLSLLNPLFPAKFKRSYFYRGGCDLLVTGIRAGLSNPICFGRAGRCLRAPPWCGRDGDLGHKEEHVLEKVGCVQKVSGPGSHAVVWVALIHCQDRTIWIGRSGEQTPIISLKSNWSQKLTTLPSKMKRETTDLDPGEVASVSKTCPRSPQDGPRPTHCALFLMRLNEPATNFL